MERKRPLEAGGAGEGARKAARVDDGDGSGDKEGGGIAGFQRAQLAAKAAELTREVAWARGRIAEMEAVVAALDAAPVQAGYFLARASEDLGVCLRELRGSEGEGEGVAAGVLEGEVSVDALGGEVGVIKRLTKEVVEVVRKGEGREGGGVEAELHERMRAVGDQLERFEAREREREVSAGTLRDELDDVKMLLDIRRRKIVALEIALRGARKEPVDDMAIGASAVDRDVFVTGNGGAGSGPGRGSGEDGEVPSGSAGRGDGGKAVKERAAAAEVLAEKRLEELQAMLEEKKALAVEVQTLGAELARRRTGLLPDKDVASSALYRALEAGLQQVALRKASLEADAERDAEERAAADQDAQKAMAAAKVASEKEADEARRLVEDLRRVAESAKAEKDKWVMTYEARKMEANAAAGVVEACERRANVSEGMRVKLKSANEALGKEVEGLRKRVTEAELRAVGDANASELPNAEELAKRLEADLLSEREKCSSFIEEVESLSAMFGDLEAENARLVKLLAEKDSVLSKVMGEKLRGRQQLATVKEEARSLTQGREFDQDKIKNLTGQVNASKRAVLESTAAASQAAGESRSMAQQLQIQKKVADEATVSARTAEGEKESMKKERDLAVAQAEEARVSGQSSSFVVRRLAEENEDLKRSVAEEESRRQQAEAAAAASAGSAESGKETLRDEIIQALMKKLHCSVNTDQPKEVALMRCGHMLSKKCVDQLVAQRSRKCPLCGIPFSASDVLNVYLD